MDGPISLFSPAEGFSIPWISIMCILWGLLGAATGAVMLVFEKTFIAGLIVFGTMCCATWAGALLFLIEGRVAASAKC